MVVGEELSVAQGVLKVNSKILEGHELKKLDKLEKSLVNGLHITGKDIRIQLNEQLRTLDGRLESQQGQLAEIQDIFKRRAEIELNYSRDLERLGKLLTSRQKEQKAKRDGWGTFSTHEIWKQLLNETRKAGRDHGALAEIYNTAITSRCTQLNEDINRIYKKCREIGFEIHEEVLKVLHELHTAMKTHHTYQSEFRQAESRLQVVEKQRTKIKEQTPKEKLEKNRKYKLIEKEVAKRTNKYTEARLKATKARNEYLLCMDAANASIHKYFVDDLSDLIDCMDFGFHQSLGRAMMMRSSALEQVRRSLQQDIDAMNKVLGSLDSRLDKKNFLEKYDQAFMIPKKFEYQPVRRDETELVQKPVIEELESRKRKLAERLDSLRVESEEIWKSLEEAEKRLLEMVNCNDYDTTRYFVEEESSRKERESESLLTKQKMDRQDMEQFYLDKFRGYILNSNRISRLQAKYDHIRNCLGDKSSAAGGATATLPRPIANSRRRIGRTLLAGQPKLFGGSLEEYLESTKEDIPLIVKSCVRVINLYGLHHQGIFRVSGSQVEINNFRESFERGEDPLADMTDASDINSVCGVLKLYLRELREPVFSVQYFDQFMDLAQLESKHEFVIKVRDLVRTWPRSIFVVMRYIFAFLNHLSEYSDENMMDPYNLAICFGPTLVPIPTDRDQVQFQNLVNELIKNFIIFHEDIYPAEVGGAVYEKYISIEPDDVQEYGNDESVNVEDEDLESEVTEDESEVLEAQAQYDFTARSSREVSFKKGDTILLYGQVSGDWWRGSVNGREGLVPDKYILLKIRGEDETRESLAAASEEMRRRTSSQSDTIRSTRSDNSPRIQRSHNSAATAVTASTPPLTRAVPHRHSISHAPPTIIAPMSAVSPVSPPVVAVAATNTAAPAALRSTVISLMPATSRESLSVDSGNPSPDATFTTTTASDRRASRSPPGGQGSEESADVRSLDLDSSLSVDEINSESTTPPPSTSRAVGEGEGGATTVIHVTAEMSALSTSLDVSSSSSVHSAEMSPVAGIVSPGPALVHEGISRGSIDRPVRSGAPRKLSPQMKIRLASQDSLASTGSNQELREELESSLAEVKAAVEDVVRRTTPDSEEVALPTSAEAESVMELAGRPAGSREAIGRKLSMEEVEFRRKSHELGGARPRSVQTNSSKILPEEGVLLKQNSWASRKSGGAPKDGDDEQSSVFARNKELWEKRMVGGSSTPTSDDEKERANFRGNRDFWEQRSLGRTHKTASQTPDLVMDLPAGALASSPPVPAPRPRKSRSPSSDSVGGRSTESDDSVSLTAALSSADTFAADTDTLKKTSAAAAVAASLGVPTPKPRPDPLLLANTQRSTVVPIRSPGPRTPKLTPKFGAVPAVGGAESSFPAGTTSSFKPSVRVKPLLQVKPNEKKDSSK